MIGGDADEGDLEDSLGSRVKSVQWREIAIYIVFLTVFRFVSRSDLRPCPPCLVCVFVFACWFSSTELGGEPPGLLTLPRSLAHSRGFHHSLAVLNSRDPTYSYLFNHYMKDLFIEGPFM